jgi:type I restriction enzyme S subunit
MTPPDALPAPAALDSPPARRWSPYPAYKDSGVPWLGEVPEHWETARVKYLAPLAYGDALSADNREEGDIPVYGSNGIVGTHSVANTQAPCLIIGRKGSYGKVNYSAVPSFAIDTTFFTDPAYAKTDIRWLYYTLPLLGLDTFSQDSAVPGLSREYAHRQEIPHIPLPEQRAIAAHLDRETSKIDALVAHMQRAIERLREYRTALISAAVTGKIDIRNEGATQAHEPQ